MKLLILFFCFTFSQQCIFAQQDPLFTQFWNVSTSYNPANSGFFYKHQAGINYRNQWADINGGPNTIMASYNTKIDKYKSGIGFNYMSEAIGLQKQNRFDLNYSYQLDLGNERKLAIGLSLGFENVNFKADWIPPSGTVDPLLPTSFRGNLFTPNVGIVYKTKKLALGLSSTNFVETNLKNGNYSSLRHYYFSASYDVDLSDNFTLKPQLLIRTDAVVSSIDINILAIYKKQYWLGITNRDLDNFAIMAGIDFKEKYRIGYSYDFPLSKSPSAFSGTHEIVLGFLLK